MALILLVLILAILLGGLGEADPVRFGGTKPPLFNWLKCRQSATSRRIFSMKPFRSRFHS